MDNLEYCSFVSIDYIICECGKTFPNEDDLRDHLDTDHASSKQENKPTSLYDNFIDKGNIKKEIKLPLVITEKLPEADLQNTVYLESNDINEYYLDNTTECETVEVYGPDDDIKQEITVEYVDEGDYDDEQTYNKMEEAEAPNLLGTQVMFKRSQLADELVILAQENEEHDYDRESKLPCDEYYFCDVYWVDYKAKLKRKNSNINLSSRRTGGGPSSDVELSEIERRFLTILGEDFGLGLPGIQVNPFPTQDLADSDNRPSTIQSSAGESSLYLNVNFSENCGKCFTLEKTVHMHMRAVHGAGAEPKRKTSICDVCGKKYAMWQRICSGCGTKRPASKPNLRAREMQKQNMGRFTCDVCGVGRSSNAALRYHQRIHTGEKPYQCTMCPKAFTMPLFLQLHTRTHTGERPYQCPLCPKAFSNQAALVRHNRVHTGVKPYACPECGKAFTQSNSMKLHYQTVHLKMPAPYKSAARKLRDAQKLGQRLGADKIIIRSGQSSPVHKHKIADIGLEIPEPRNALLFRHRSRREEPQFEYVMEPIHCDMDGSQDY